MSVLSELVIGRCYGHDEYNPEYRQKIRDRFLTLLQMRDDW